MEHRPLGRTGVSVSKLCLGTMMFGAWGNPDHDDSIRIIHRALDAGINFVDTADVYSQRRVRGHRRQGARQRPARRRRARHQGALPDGRGPEPARQLAPLDHPRGRGLAAPAQHRLDRPLPDPPPRPGDRHRGDARRAHRPRPPGQGPLHRLLHVPRLGRSSRPSGRRATGSLQRFVCEQPPYSILVRGIEADVLPTCARHGMGVIPWAPLASGWLSGRWRKDAGEPGSTRADRLPARYDLSLPANQRKLDAADELAQLADEAGHDAHPARDRLRRSTIPPSPPRSSARARWSTSRASSPRPTSCSTRRCSTASTRSSHPARPSTRRRQRVGQPGARARGAAAVGRLHPGRGPAGAPRHPAAE